MASGQATMSAVASTDGRTTVAVLAALRAHYGGRARGGPAWRREKR